MVNLRLKEIKEIYSRLPSVACRGLCAESCGPIDMTTVEREHIRDIHGVTIPKGNGITGPARCPALGMMGTCTVYEDRPLICRLYGAARGGLECPHGCETDGPPLDQWEVFRILADAFMTTGEWTVAHGRGVKALLDRLSDPDGEADAANDGTLDRSSLHSLYTQFDQLPDRYQTLAATGLRRIGDRYAWAG